MKTNNTKGSLLWKETETKKKLYVRCWKKNYNKKVTKKNVQKNLIINNGKTIDGKIQEKQNRQ